MWTKIKSGLKWLYAKTLGKKTTIGGILVLAGYAIGGKYGNALVELGKLILTIGLSDKAIRTVSEKREVIGAFIAKAVNKIKKGNNNE